MFTQHTTTSRPADRSASPTSRAAKGGWLLLWLLLGIAFPAAATADVRQHVLGAGQLDPDVMIQELVQALTEQGYLVSKSSELNQTLAVDDQVVTYRKMDYYASDNGSGAVSVSNITVAFFVLDEPDEDAARALTNLVSTQHGYSGTSLLRLHDVGVMGWIYYPGMGSSATSPLDTTLLTWRETYVSDP